MATRPVFVTRTEGRELVQVSPVTFQWHPGLSVSQKQKSIASLHAAAREQLGISRVLEISTKSPQPEGVALSAFKLGYVCKRTGQWVSAESAFQGSKVFEHGGPFHDLYYVNSRAAKAFFKERNLGRLIAFSFYGQQWPTEPKTVFYDWLYLKCLSANEELLTIVQNYDAFTDIEFNPKRSLNCQAYAAALFVSLSRRDLAGPWLRDPESFISGMKDSVVRRETGSLGL